VIGAIVLGFVNDPIARWSWPGPRDYLTYFPQFTSAFGGEAFDHGTAHTVADFSARALWLPPGVQLDEAALASLMERSFGPKRLQVAATMMGRMQSYHGSGAPLVSAADRGRPRETEAWIRLGTPKPRAGAHRSGATSRLSGLDEPAQHPSLPVTQV
jgi:hypothetical protein